MKYHALRDVVKEGEMGLKYCPTKEQLADIFTKWLSTDRFEFPRNRLGVIFLRRCVENSVIPTGKTKEELGANQQLVEGRKELGNDVILILELISD